MEVKTLILMQGISGSGKSTAAKILRTGLKADDQVPIVYGSDEYWIGEGGMYEFDPNRLQDAHEWNQRRVAMAMDTSPISHIIVDNTNTRQWEADPYFELARTFGWDIQVVTIDTDLATALERNSRRPAGRALPEKVIKAQHERIERLVIPPRR